MANQAHPKNLAAPRKKQKLRDIWKSKYLSGPEKIMLWLGWVPASIVRYLDCVWCGKEFIFSGEATADPPRYCTDTHRRAAKKAREKRLAGPGIEPGVDAAPAPPAKASPQRVPPKGPSGGSDAVKSRPKCRCHGHTGKAKQKYPTNAAAAIGLMRRHLKHANGRIYQCPTSDYWHITTQMERKVA